MNRPLPSKPRLMDRIRYILRRKHYSIRTEKAYLSWIRCYILFHNKRHPKEMGVPEIEAYLTHLAVHDNVAPATQNQAFNAILFLYNKVLSIPLGQAGIDAIRARKKRNLPVVLAREEAIPIED